MLVLIYVVRKIKCQILISAFEGNFNLISKVVIVFKQNIIFKPLHSFECLQTILLKYHHAILVKTWKQCKMHIFANGCRENGSILWHYCMNIFHIDAYLNMYVVHIKNSNILSNIQTDKIYEFL